MGLDIKAVGRLVPVDPPHEYDDDSCYERGHVAPDRNPDFPGQLDGIEPICHLPANPATFVSFRAGSYSGYNWWRATLCRFALNVEPEVVWNGPGHYAGKPFVELIHFSDCEGSIGPTVSAKLARDFACFEDNAHAYAAAMTDGEGWFRKYREWREAFELAAQGGFVDFR